MGRMNANQGESCSRPSPNTSELDKRIAHNMLKIQLKNDIDVSHSDDETFCVDDLGIKCKLSMGTKNGQNRQKFKLN